MSDNLENMESITEPPVPKYSVISTRTQWDELLPSLKQAKLIGIDTESSNYYALVPQICLIQVSLFLEQLEPLHFIIDTVLFEDGWQGDLGNILKDPTVEKIFHSADDDLRFLKKQFNFEFSNIFDTHIAAKFLNMLDKLSLQALVLEYVGFQLDKKWQKADWLARPIQSEMLDYAICDTIFLKTIREQLIEQLHEKSRYVLFEDYCQSLVHVPAYVQPNQENGWIKLSKKLKTPEYLRSTLKAIHMVRHEFALRENSAAFLIINDYDIGRIVYKLQKWIKDEDANDRSLAEWEREFAKLVKSDKIIPYMFENRLKIWETSLAGIDKDNHQKNSKLTPSESKMLKQIMDVKREVAADLEIDPVLIFSKKAATDLVIQARKLSAKKPAGKKSGTKKHPQQEHHDNQQTPAGLAADAASESDQSDELPLKEIVQILEWSAIQEQAYCQSFLPVFAKLKERRS